jgi:uncharacterized protein (TIGR00303 family)
LIQSYTHPVQGQRWLRRYYGQSPVFACILGFTETSLVPGISAAGATPHDREFTAIADAEFLINGPQPQPCYALPPLQAGVSPVVITRAIVEALHIPCHLFNAGLLHPPSVPTIELGGLPARCLSTGHALELPVVHALFQQGQVWGHELAAQAPSGYLILSECVVGGTTTALGVLFGLGLAADGKVGSSHPTCNHIQKKLLVQQGLDKAGLFECCPADPFALLAAVGDPMQAVAAGMTLSASQTAGVLLAGGTQMLAVYALCCAIAQAYDVNWQPEQVVVGTTRWVAEDATGDAVGLAELIGLHYGSPLTPCLLATQLSFAQSRYPQLQMYEQGYVKEGVGAGGCAIAAHLYRGWQQQQLLEAIEAEVAQLIRAQGTVV